VNFNRNSNENFSIMSKKIILNNTLLANFECLNRHYKTTDPLTISFLKIHIHLSISTHISGIYFAAGARAFSDIATEIEEP
jgi:hypothetical protein